LGRNQDFIEVLLQDHRTLQRLGVSRKQMAQWLRDLTNDQFRESLPQRQLTDENGQPLTNANGHPRITYLYNGQWIEVDKVNTRGYQFSPLPGPISLSSSQIRITNHSNGGTILTTEMHPDLIEQYGFFEGDGGWRNNPESIVNIFTGRIAP
jgi:hypothetical protein